jgi:hypothetical protein
MVSFIPPPIHIVKKCHRCGHQYSVDKKECNYCKDLTEIEVRELVRKLENEKLGNKNIGILFIILTILIFIGMIMYI